MTVRLYRSTDASAPVLNGTAGSLIALLDACLVTGYGEKLPAGWSKPFFGTNTAVFRNAASGSQGYYRIDDTLGASAGILGYEAMTDVDTGTERMPSTVQVATTLYIVKSSTADATTRGWTLLATENICYFISYVNDVNPSTSSSACAFGAISSYKTGDAYNNVLIASTATAYNGGVVFPVIVASCASVSAGHYIARSHTQLGGSTAIGKHIDSAKAVGATTIGNGGCTYPNPVDGTLMMSPIWVHEVSAPRGFLPGVWAPLHARPVGNGDTFAGSGSLTGKSFLALQLYLSGMVMFETSDTW